VSKDKDVAYALIDGEMCEYDIWVDSVDGIFKVDENTHDYIGRGTVESVCGIPNHNKKLVFCYKKKEIKKKRRGW
jgi:hypothetical protein